MKKKTEAKKRRKRKETQGKGKKKKRRRSNIQKKDRAIVVVQLLPEICSSDLFIYFS